MAVPGDERDNSDGRSSRPIRYGTQIRAADRGACIAKRTPVLSNTMATTTKEMSAEHKAALEQGRAEGRAVRDYLEALRSAKPKRGRKRTPESIQARLAAIDEAMIDASVVDELQLVQERRDLQDELANMGPGDDLAALETAFIAVAQAYGARKGISYGSWRDVGVPAATLKAAGISRSN